METGKIRVVLQATLRSHPDLKKVPLAINYAKTEDARTLLRVADNVHVYQFPYSVAPGTPPERLKILKMLSSKLCTIAISWRKRRSPTWKLRLSTVRRRRRRSRACTSLARRSSHN